LLCGCPLRARLRPQQQRSKNQRSARKAHAGQRRIAPPEPPGPVPVAAPADAPPQQPSFPKRTIGAVTESGAGGFAGSEPGVERDLPYEPEHNSWGRLP
jgi:hypothetical protein